MKLDKHIVDMFTELTKPADDVKMEKTCYGTISVVDGTRYVKLDGGDLLVPAASTVKTSNGDRVTVLMKNHSLTITGNLTAPATDGDGGSSGGDGTAATIEVGTVTTGEAGSSASVTNSGTKSAAVFDFVIPRGDKGEKGDTGPQGEKGDTGTWDGTIPDHEHTVSDITDFPTSLPANGGNADTVNTIAGDIDTNTGTVYPAFVDSNNSTSTAETLKTSELLQFWGSKGGISQLSIGKQNSSSGLLRLYDSTGDYFSVLRAAHGPAADVYCYLPDKSGTLALKEDIPAKLPANGGNADTVGGKAASELVQCIGKITSATIANDPNYGISYEGNLAPATAVEIGLPSGWYHLKYLKHQDSGNIGWGLQIALPLTKTSFLPMYRFAANDETSWSTWHAFADGGNADTLDGLHANEIASNPNLLDNPDFKINQRGQASYPGNGVYSVDRWKCKNDALVIPTDNGLKVGLISDASSTTLVDVAEVQQIIENYSDFSGKTGTVSVNVGELTAVGARMLIRINDSTGELQFPVNQAITSAGTISVTFRVPDGITYMDIWLRGADMRVSGETADSYTVFQWAKLELGSVATPFIPPNPTEELLKIQSMNDDGTPKLTSNNALPTIMNSQMVSNPNLLDNPDFKINQRGETAWSIGTTARYFVDRWYSARSTLSLSDDGLMFAWNGKDGTDGWIQEKIESPPYFAKTVTISFNANDTIYNETVEIPTAVDTGKYKAVAGTSSLFVGVGNYKGKYFSAILLSTSTEPALIKWIKSELGGIATPFIPPNPATELEKCQRYYYSTYQGVPAGTPASYVNELVLNAISANRFNHTTIDFPTTMRTTPTVKFFDPYTGEEGYACMSGSAEKVPMNVLIAGRNRAAIGSSGLTVGTDYYLHYTASAEL